MNETASTAPVESREGSASQAVKAQLRLREMILAGELPGGSRIAELAIVEKLGVSRTPIRAALMRLEQEGLLETLPNGGFAVRTFSEREVADAIELRGTVEGLAARLAAQDVAALLDYRAAPHGAAAHPTAEHLLPLFVALGAANGDPPTRHRPPFAYGGLAMDAYVWQDAAATN